jgi:SAM-dependent methyltransferase
MRSFAHWTPTYLRDRIATMVYERLHPEHPWLTRDANLFLQSWFRQSDIGLEFGSGRSTIWIARRVSELHSVETSSQWAHRVRESIERARLTNIIYMELSSENEKGLIREHENVFSNFHEASLDFCLIDGDCRDVCARLALKKLRPGGILIIDNVNRHLPSNSAAPASRSLSDGPDGVIWEEVERALRAWRRLWTSSGVTDTAIFFKPIENSAENLQ